MKETIGVCEAAKRLNMKPLNLEGAIEKGLMPFLNAVIVPCEKSNRYIIPRERFERWISGRDLLPVRMV
jgi:hypothetical protein